MQLINSSSQALSSHSQRTFPFSSSLSDEHENYNEATELCSLSEFARKLHAKTQDDLSQLPVDIQDQFVPTPQPEYVTELTVSGMSDLRKNHVRQQLTKAIDFLMEQEFLISRKINEQAREKKDKNQEFSIDQALDNLLLQLEEHRDLVKSGVQRDTDEYMRFQKSKKFHNEDDDQFIQQNEQRDTINKISKESYLSDCRQEKIRKQCFQYLLSHCNFERKSGEDGNNIITFKWKLTQEEKQHLQQLKNDSLNGESAYIESKDSLPQEQQTFKKKGSQDYEDDMHQHDQENDFNPQNNNYYKQQTHSEIGRFEFARKEVEEKLKQHQQEKEEDQMEQLFRSIMEADSLDDLLGKTDLQNNVNINQISCSDSYLSRNLTNQDNHHSRKVNKTTEEKQEISSPIDNFNTIKLSSKNEDNVLKVISTNGIDLMNLKDKSKNEQNNQKISGTRQLFNQGNITKQENTIPLKVIKNLSNKMISDTWKPKGIGNQNLNCIKQLRN